MAHSTSPELMKSKLKRGTSVISAFSKTVCQLCVVELEQDDCGNKSGAKGPNNEAAVP